MSIKYNLKYCLQSPSLTWSKMDDYDYFKPEDVKLLCENKYTYKNKTYVIVHVKNLSGYYSIWLADDVPNIEIVPEPQPVEIVTIKKTIKESESKTDHTIGGLFLVFNKNATFNGPYVQQLRYNFRTLCFEKLEMYYYPHSPTTRERWIPLPPDMVVVAKLHVNVKYRDLTPIRVEHDGWEPGED